METGGICASPFWNQSLSWNTHDPFVSECFKHIVLVIGSCGVLWIVAPFEFYKISRYRGSPAPWSVLSIAKIVCKVLLLIVCSVDLGKEIYAYKANIKTGLDGLIAAVAFFVTIVLTVIITMMCKRKGLRSSIALPSFWMISTITTLISLYDDIHDLDKNNWVSVVSLVDDSFSFTISVLQLFLSNMSEKGTSTSGRDFMNYCPLEGRTLISRLTYSWLNGLLVTSMKKNLHTDDLVPLCSEFRSTAVSNTFSESWNVSDSLWEDQTSSFPSAEHQDNKGLLGHQMRQDIIRGETRRKSLLKTLFKISSEYMLISAFFEILYTALYFLPVFILSLFLNDTEEPKWHFYLYACAMFVVLLLSTIADSQRKYYSLISALKIKTAIMNVVFEKALVSQQLENAEKYIKEDAENIFQMMCLINEVWGASLRIILGVYLLWLFLGTSCFVGIGTASVLIPAVILVKNTANILNAKAFISKSEWLTMLSECLQRIRCLKFYSWEDVLLQKIKILRSSETRRLRKSTFLKIIAKLILMCSVSLVSLAAFSYFVLVTDSFDMKIIFLSFALICLLRLPFSNILRLLAHFVQGLSSVSEVQHFLTMKEVEILQSDNNLEYGIHLQNATFSWENNNEFLLKNVTVNIDQNCLVAVVGESKSGKTSFIRALLGEMKKLAGSSFMKGKTAFITDNAWIQNATLEENILSGRPKLDDFYHNTLDSCDLLREIENLPQADETQIGERGYPLNSDQKLKVDLARTVYQNAEIYLIDDAFRGTYEFTAEKLFEKVIGPNGILSNKIRIFTTSDLTFLPLTDYIIFLKDGEISEQGEYSELINKNDHFTEYLKKEEISKSLQIKREKDLSQIEAICLENYKRTLDPWFSTSGLHIKGDVNSFLQEEVMISNKTFFSKILHYLQMNGYLVTFVALLTAALGNCCGVASLMWLAWNTSEYEADRKMHRDIYIYGGFILSEVVSFMTCGITVSCGSTVAIRKFYSWLLNRILKAPLVTFGSAFVDRVLHSFDKDLQFVDEEIPVRIFMWLITGLKFPVLLVIIFLQYPILFLLLFYLIPSVYFLKKFYMSAWRQLHFLSVSTSCPLSNFVKNTFQGISHIRASNRASTFISQFRNKLDKHNRCHFLLMLVLRWLCNSIEICGNIFIFLIILGIVFHGKMQKSNFIGIAVIFSLQVSECLIAFIYLSSVLEIDLSCLERLVSFTNVKPETEFENRVSTSWLTSGSIVIRNLTTNFGEGFYPALNDITISVCPGEKVAIVGKEDSGISTILDSIFRIREINEREIFIDNVDISHIRLHNLRSSLAIIPQYPLIFNSTLRDNLDPERKYTDEELLAVIRKSGLDSNFTNLSDAIHSSISNTEKYQISLARCLLKTPKIVILEETENPSTLQHFQDSTLLSFGSSPVPDGHNRSIFITSGEIVEVTSCAS